MFVPRGEHARSGAAGGFASICGDVAEPTRAVGACSQRLRVAAQALGMQPDTREIYTSSNGDKWLLAREPESGRVFVKHIPNLPSGGNTSDIDIGAFLCERSYGPQHIELLRLIGTLIEKPGRSPN